MHCGERGEERGSGDFNVRGLAGKTALRNSIGACRAPAASHISAGRPHQKWGFFGMSFPLSVSTSLMVGVGSGSKHFHALGVLACGPLKPPSGARREPWVGVGKEVEELPPPAPPEHSTGLPRSSAGYSWAGRKFFPFLVLELLRWVQVVLHPVELS